MEAHDSTGHSGIYQVINELRPKYWIENCFVQVKKLLKRCIQCRSMHARTIKLNENIYRDFRMNPRAIPFRDVFLDHLGAFDVYLDNSKTKDKVYVLLFSCLWSRSINLKICLRADVHSFIQGFQLHVLDYGTPSLCWSDLSSAIVAGANTISCFLNDFETERYFKENNIDLLNFEHYPKGNNSLGSLVESCVKMVKFYIAKVLRKKVLPLESFRYLVAEAQHYINKRPICLKEALRDLPNAEIIEAITPELLLKGYSTNSLNIAPSFQPKEETWQPSQKSTDLKDCLKDLNECLPWRIPAVNNTSSYKSCRSLHTKTT